MLDTMKVRDFIDELSSNSPAPGGGSVAALCGSLASALTSMVFSLTVGKKIYEELGENEKKLVDEGLLKAKKLKDEFLDLMNKDTEAFNLLMSAFRMNKSTDEEKAIRSAKIQEAYKDATLVPLEVARKSYEIYDIIDISVEHGNKNAISDGGVAALIAQAAVEGAIMNVKINLSSIKDEEFVKETRSEIERISAEGHRRKEKIVKIVNENL